MKPKHEWTDYGAGLWTATVNGHYCSVEWNEHEGWDWFVGRDEGGVWGMTPLASGHILAAEDDTAARLFAMRLAELCAER